MQGAFLGPEFSQEQIESELSAIGARFERLDDNALLQRSVDALLDECALGWFQGRMEFGPRALGARSILGDPRSPRMQSTLNLKIKFRESFRPFAPAVLAEDVAEWFELAQESPYMLLVADVQPKHRRARDENQASLEGIALLNTVRSSIPAVTHVDHSARIQTVHADTNPRFHALLTEFKLRTGCGVLVNTSFNVRGEPIVGSPTDAFRCFMGTDMEALAIGNCWLRKEAQDPALAQRYEGAFGLD
jgi:carbamoyltransferase